MPNDPILAPDAHTGASVSGRGPDGNTLPHLVFLVNGPETLVGRPKFRVEPVKGSTHWGGSESVSLEKRLPATP